MLLSEKNSDPILPMTEIVSFIFRSETFLFLCFVSVNLLLLFLFFSTNNSLPT